jgi:hypothetical protein
MHLRFLRLPLPVGEDTDGQGNRDRYRAERYGEAHQGTRPGEGGYSPGAATSHLLGSGTWSRLVICRLLLLT